MKEKGILFQNGSQNDVADGCPRTLTGLYRGEFLLAGSGTTFGGSPWIPFHQQRISF